MSFHDEGFGFVAFLARPAPDQQRVILLRFGAGQTAALAARGFVVFLARPAEVPRVGLLPLGDGQAAALASRDFDAVRRRLFWF